MSLKFVKKCQLKIKLPLVIFDVFKGHMCDSVKYM